METTTRTTAGLAFWLQISFWTDRFVVLHLCVVPKQLSQTRHDALSTQGRARKNWGGPTIVGFAMFICGRNWSDVVGRDKSPNRWTDLPYKSPQVSQKYNHAELHPHGRHDSFVRKLSCDEEDALDDRVALCKRNTIGGKSRAIYLKGIIGFVTWLDGNHPAVLDEGFRAAARGRDGTLNRAAVKDKLLRQWASLATPSVQPASRPMLPFSAGSPSARCRHP
jgi:hypothetical protein